MSRITMSWKSRLQKEIGWLSKKPIDGIVCYPVDDNLTILNANIRGIEGTPYEGGDFQLEILVPNTYPFTPPNVRFLTKIYHPNVDDKGRVCVDLLKEANWLPSITLQKILQSLQLLLQEPNPNDPLDEKIGKEYINDYENFKKAAQSWTELYAKPASQSQ